MPFGLKLKSSKRVQHFLVGIYLYAYIDIIKITQSPERKIQEL